MRERERKGQKVRKKKERVYIYKGRWSRFQLFVFVVVVCSWFRSLGWVCGGLIGLTLFLFSFFCFCDPTLRDVALTSFNLLIYFLLG